MRFTSIQGVHLVGMSFGGYVIERFLGKGLWNAVYQARLPTQQQSTLLTLIALPETLSPTAQARFMTRFVRECIILTHLSHPQILPLIDFGEQSGYAYIVTPLVAGNTLASILKKNGGFSPTKLPEVLTPLAQGLDYAHRLGVVHGALSSANVLLDAKKNLRIVRFGINRLGVLRGLEDHQLRHDSHLLNISGTPLGGWEYMAPEVLQGNAFSPGADVYAVGILLFELLSGSLPFLDENSPEAAQQHPYRELPPLLGREIPSAIDEIVARATLRDPLKRFLSVGQIAEEIERVVYRQPLITTSTLSTSAAIRQLPSVPSTTRSAVRPIQDGWQLHPPIVTGHGPAISIKQQTVQPSLWQQQTKRDIARSTKGIPQANEEHVDPCTSWTQTTQAGKINGSTAKLDKEAALREGRQRTVAMIATGSVLALLGGGIGLRRLLFQDKQATSTLSTTQTSIHSIPIHSQTGAKTPPTRVPPQATAHANASTPQQITTPTPPPANSTATPTQPIQPTQPPPTPVPTKAPTPAGSIIGSTNQAINMSKDFVNPSDGQASLLVHLSSDSFVAYEKACTHAGSPVYYDTVSHQLLCPTHGSIFDPAQNGQVVHGPATRPLATVAIHVNEDGTITAG